MYNKRHIQILGAQICTKSFNVIFLYWSIRCMKMHDSLVYSYTEFFGLLSSYIP